jgi:hypothetical protein
MAESIMKVANYCVSFVDLLGQRNALAGQGLVPPGLSGAEFDCFMETVKDSVGAIRSLQNQAEEMLNRKQAKSNKSSLRAGLNADEQTIFDEYMHSRTMKQHWSDGLVSFVCLGGDENKCVLKDVFNIFALSGALCLIGLAIKRPLRGAIEIAWGVELRPNELYGAAIARSYELESVVAQYPRVVVGNYTVRYLEAHATNPHNDIASRMNREFAEICLQFLAQDVDGVWMLHYLGEKFQQLISGDSHSALYVKALEFIEAEYAAYRLAQDSKLAYRYAWLHDYFLAHGRIDR